MTSYGQSRLPDHLSWSQVRNLRGTDSDPEKIMKGHFIDTSEVPTMGQLMIPRIVSDYIGQGAKIELFANHVRHTPGESTGSSVWELISCSSQDEREELLRRLSGQSYEGVKSLDEVPHSRME